MTIINSVIGSTETAILTVPAGQNWASVCLFFCNYDQTNPETITVHVRPAGAAPANQNTILKSLTIDPQDTFTFNMEKLLLSATDVVSAIGSSGNRVTATASYMQL